MACEVNNKKINSQCAELLVRPTYNIHDTCKNSLLFIFHTLNYIMIKR